MKIQSKIAFITSAAALVASPLVIAGHCAHDEVTPESCEVAVTDPVVCPPVVIVKDGAAATEEPVCVKDGGNTTGETGTGTVVDGGEVVTSDPGTTGEPGEGTPVPLDWVKRDGGLENPDVIFYNMAGGPLPVFKGENAPVVKEISPDEKATAIEAKGNFVIPQINREEKGPVALVKKGRVFLR